MSILVINPSASSNASSNSSLAVTQTAHGFSVGQAIYFTGSAWALAEANAASTLGLGIVSAVADANDFTVMFSGYVSGLSGFTAGNYYFVSDSSAGTLTSTEPSTVGNYSNPLFFAITSSTGVVLPFRPNLLESSSTASNTSLTVAQTAHGFSVGQAIYFTGSAWALAKSNASSTLGIGVVSAVADANDFTVMFEGYITGLTGLSAGNYYFVSDSTAGTLTSTQPTSTSSFTNPLLFALSALTGVVLPFRPASLGGVSTNVVTKTTTYTAQAGDVVLCDTSGGGFTVTLPASSSNGTQTIRVKKISSDGNTLTIGRTGTDLIDGATTQTTSTQWGKFTFIADGSSSWDIF